jgi:hypothetical protein
MMRHETRFATDGELLIVRGRVTGPLGTTIGRFVLDTGAAFATLTPELVDLVGYGARDGIRRTRVRLGGPDHEIRQQFGPHDADECSDQRCSCRTDGERRLIL